MAIYGKRRTMLQITGLLGGLLGRLSYLFTNDLTFTLKLAGAPPDQFQSPRATQMCQVGAAGIRLIVIVTDEDDEPVNVRDLGAFLLKMLKPDGTAIEKTAQVLTNGTDGRIYYTTVEADLDQAGVYRIQALVNDGGAAPKSTRWGTFQVGENIIVEEEA